MSKQSKESQRATLPAPTEQGEIQNARNWGGEKETVRRDILVAFDARARKAERARNKEHGYPDEPSDGFRSVVDARWYMGRSSSASEVHCSVWIHTRDGRRISGRGSAGGWGYHKESAALASALRSAGVRLARSIGGVGDSAISGALHAVAIAAGYSRSPRTIL